MAFQVPESKRSLHQNQFEFTLPNGETHRIPKAKYLTTGQVETLSGRQDKLTILDILALFGDGDASDAVRTLDTEQIQALLEAWQADSGLELGESSASTEQS